MLPETITDSIPGPKSRELAATLLRHEARTLTYPDADFPVFWQRASGTNVWDVDGNRFVDFTAAFGVAGLGHSNPMVRDALLRQGRELFHAMGDVHPAAQKAALCRELSRITFERWGAGAGKTILCNSGFEAVEAALKTSLLHSGKPGVIAFTGAYHGLGYGALETIGIPFFRDPFRAQLKDFASLAPYPHCFRCPFGATEDYRLEGKEFPNCSTQCLEKIYDEMSNLIATREIGCVLVEPVQGRGGDIPPPLDFMRLLRQICDEHKILLVADEIYTGFNRTGALFACDHSQVAPDIICLGKALTSGFPLSACVGRQEVMDAWPASRGEALHTSTFLGNPLGCAMALASIAQHTAPGAAATVRKQGAKLKAALAGLDSHHVANLRGVGLLIGLELVRHDGSPFGELVTAIMKRGLKEGLILLGSGPHANVLSFSPPFSISDEEIEFLAARLQEYLTSLPGSIS